MLIRFKDDLDEYHQRRADKHGYLYIFKRSFGNGSLVEGRSLATGALCTLDKRFIEVDSNGQEAP